MKWTASVATASRFGFPVFRTASPTSRSFVAIVLVPPAGAARCPEPAAVRGSGPPRRFGTPASAGTACRRRAAGRISSAGMARRPGTLATRSFMAPCRPTRHAGRSLTSFRCALRSGCRLKPAFQAVSPFSWPAGCAGRHAHGRCCENATPVGPSPAVMAPPAWSAGFSRHSPPQAGGGTDLICRDGVKARNAGHSFLHGALPAHAPCRQEPYVVPLRSAQRVPAEAGVPSRFAVLMAGGVRRKTRAWTLL